MQTSKIRCNGVRDSTEQSLINNWAAQYAQRLVEDEAAAREAADKKLGEQITGHVTETATDTKSSHVFLSDEVNSDLNAATGKTAATPKAVKTVNDALIAAESAFGRQIAQESAIRAIRAMADRELGERIDAEKAEREAADTEFTKSLDAEITNRQNGDENLQNQITKEQQDRTDADAALGERINEEKTSREAADSALSERVSVVEKKAHTHENMDILDGIDADRVRKWDEGSEGEITLGEYLEHLAEAERQFGLLWGALGMTVYDGGWFGMEQLDAPLDGGLFEDTEFTELDCGGFEPYVVPSGGIGTVVDGGTY